MAVVSGLLSMLILFYLSAAFDSVSHNVLLERLISIGITGISFVWVRSYLFGQTWYVQIKGFRSWASQITSGMPQGSALGPLLFIIYLLPLGHIFIKFCIHFL